jgi:hypothetical protein
LYCIASIDFSLGGGKSLIPKMTICSKTTNIPFLALNIPQMSLRLFFFVVYILIPKILHFNAPIPSLQLGFYNSPHATIPSPSYPTHIHNVRHTTKPGLDFGLDSGFWIGFWILDWILDFGLDSGFWIGFWTESNQIFPMFQNISGDK